MSYGLKVRQCRGPRRIRLDGTMDIQRHVCNSTNLKVVQPSDNWITYYCFDCYWTNVEAASPGQLQREYDELIASQERVFGAMGDEPPPDMPENIRALFVGSSVA